MGKHSCSSCGCFCDYAHGDNCTSAHDNTANPDFVDAQGTTFMFVPPVADYIGFSDPAEKLCALVDYAGLANEFAAEAFGTETDGTVIERPLADGRAEVTVSLQTKDALFWIIQAETDADGNFAGCDFASAELLFGHRAPEVLAGENPALGESFFKVVFINTEPGAPLPDLIPAVILGTPPAGFELMSISLRAQAHGTLADGTPGRVEVTQTGLFMTPFMGATADGFPAEKIILRAIGK